LKKRKALGDEIGHVVGGGGKNGGEKKITGVRRNEEAGKGKNE